MTDALDFNVDALTTSVFDSRQSVIAPLPGESALALQDSDYIDIITLISILTSSRDIDYQIVTDFFLTFRSFISQQSLLKLLVLRLKWSIQCIDDSAHEHKINVGKLTLVRTFVVIRHWLVNYFSEDFISSEPLRKLFVDEINSLQHNELFVQRVISNLKKNWTSCCNKSWDENVVADDFYSFTTRIGPQTTRNKRLSILALNQKSDPMTRNSMMLSLYDTNTIHKLPIPTRATRSKREPQLAINPKNSLFRLNVATQGAKSAFDPSTLRTSNISTSQRSPTLPLYVPLDRSPLKGKSTMRHETSFPKTALISKLIPPTPVKKMDVTVPLLPSSHPQPKGLRSLIESWLKTFNLGASEKEETTLPQVERFMTSVVSVAKLQSKDLDKLAEGKFDILCARTIDEFEYLIRFHNEFMGRHASISANEGFSFTNDNDGERASNIDNLNLYQTISNISRNVLSIQQHHQQHNSVSDTKSYISYDSALSNSIHEKDGRQPGNLKKKADVQNLREFNFEKGVGSKEVVGDDHTAEKFEFENDDNSMKTFPTSIISENTPQQIVVDGDHIDEDVDLDSTANVLVLDESTSTPSTAVKTQKHVSLPISSSSAPFTKITGRPKSDSAVPLETTMRDLSMSSLIARPQSPMVTLDVEETVLSVPDAEYGIQLSADVQTEAHPDYNDIDSFVSTYEDIEDMDGSESIVNNYSDMMENEPSTPPSQNGIISSTPLISPIKSLHESAHISPIKNLQETHHQQHSSVSVDVHTIDSRHDLNLNRIPSFSRISNGSITSHVSHYEQRTSYLSKRSIGTHRASESVNSIFSGMKTSKLVNFSIKHESQIQEDVIPPIHNIEDNRSGAHTNSSADSTESTVNSEDIDEPFPMTGIDSHVRAELAAISDDSYQDDPVAAALLKLEGNYIKSGLKRVTSTVESVSTGELSRQVEDLAIHTPVKVQPAVIDQRRKTRLFSLTPVRQKQINEASSTVLLELLLNHQVTSDILKIQNADHHASFILNYDSKTIAEQLTLIEKDVLLEIDWRELVELKWKSEDLQPAHSWLALLVQNEDMQGVDLCSSRFNLTINWVTSEILLTKNPYLQKVTIQRFIHIAQNCKMLQNYSTMMEILLALISEKVMSLKDTWRMVEPGDILTFKSLEQLASPAKNFKNLRQQLNDIKPSLGCVPFIVVYLSDLCFNIKEKRSVTGSLINFGKFKMTAKIARSLIQCIQWSTLYRIEPNEEVLSKCMYIKALTEGEMIECMKANTGT